MVVLLLRGRCKGQTLAQHIIAKVTLVTTKNKFKTKLDLLVQCMTHIVSIIIRIYANTHHRANSKKGIYSISDLSQKTTTSDAKRTPSQKSVQSVFTRMHDDICTGLNTLTRASNLSWRQSTGAARCSWKVTPVREYCAKGMGRRTRIEEVRRSDPCANH